MDSSRSLILSQLLPCVQKISYPVSCMHFKLTPGQHHAKQHTKVHIHTSNATWAVRFPHQSA